MTTLDRLIEKACWQASLVRTVRPCGVRRPDRPVRAR